MFKVLNLNTYTRFLERKIWNSLVNVADRLKKLRGSGQTYLVIVKNSAYVVHFFLGNIYGRRLKFLQAVHENFDCDLTHRFFLFMISIRIDTVVFFHYDINPHLVNVKNSAYVVHFFLGNIYSRGLKFLQVVHENFDGDLTHGFFYS